MTISNHNSIIKIILTVVQMVLKYKERELAIKLRKKGLSYSEILKKVPVAKSTLSLWLRSVGLSKRQEQRLTEKKLAAMKRGWESCHKKRLNITEMIKNKARSDIGKISKRELWLMGVMLYWAEGAKEKKWNSGVGLKFSNSDPTMINFFLKWLKEICLIFPQDIIYELYIHETANWKDAVRYWSKIILIPPSKIRVYFKHNKIQTKRKNIGDDYHGLIMMRIRKSANLNRKITGWIEGVCQHCRVV